MKKLITICAVIGLMLAVANAVHAQYVSTFTVSQADFSLTGFSWDHDSNPSTPNIETAGPDNLYINKVSGTYDLNIPLTGGPWDVYVNGWVNLDYDIDHTWDDTYTFTNEYLGNNVSPGPSTSWGPDSIPFTAENGGTTYNFTLAYEVDLDGSYPSGNFGMDAYASLTLSGDLTGMLLKNANLTYWDNLSGGGDGIIDGWMSCELTVTAVPEPATMFLLGSGLIGLVAVFRKRFFVF